MVEFQFEKKLLQRCVIPFMSISVMGQLSPLLEMASRSLAYQLEHQHNSSALQDHYSYPTQP